MWWPAFSGSTALGIYSPRKSSLVHCCRKAARSDDRRDASRISAFLIIQVSVVTSHILKLRSVKCGCGEIGEARSVRQHEWMWRPAFSGSTVFSGSSGFWNIQSTCGVEKFGKHAVSGSMDECDNPLSLTRVAFGIYSPSVGVDKLWKHAVSGIWMNVILRCDCVGVCEPDTPLFRFESLWNLQSTRESGEVVFSLSSQVTITYRTSSDEADRRRGNRKLYSSEAGERGLHAISSTASLSCSMNIFSGSTTRSRVF